jgi:hypothetical protein
MKQVTTTTVGELQELADKMYGNLVKGVVDINKRVLAIDAEMHVDIEQYFLEQGSTQQDLWGINLHPDKFGTNDFVEFDSMINIRPRQNNISRNVEDEKIRGTIVGIVEGIVKK